MTKGAFFHHFPSKEALGVALIDDWTETTGTMFAQHPYNFRPDPLDRVFGYLDLRRQILGQPIPEFACVAGTTVQEAYESSAPIRAAAERSVTSGFEHVRPHLAQALGASGAGGDGGRPGATGPGGGAGRDHPGQGAE